VSCPHRLDVEVYVLGALEPGEREVFETHLAGCRECARALAEVAGLPGLLSRVPAPDAPDPSDPPPQDLLPTTLARVRRRRRAGWALAAVAVVVALLGGGAAAWTAVQAGLLPGGAPVAGDAPAGLPATAPEAAAQQVVLPPVGDGETSGLAGLTARPWGTEIALACRYHGPPRPVADPDEPRTTYVLIVRGPDGSEQQIARWSPPPDQDVVVAAATDLPPDRVRGLEVRTAEGTTVMRS
jgi:hypothetical protein